MESTFSYRFEILAESNVVYLSGIIDAQAEESFAILQKRISGYAVLLDFSDVGRINSIGIALILRCLKQCTKERGLQVQVRGLNQINSMLFKMSGIFLMAKEIK